MNHRKHRTSSPYSLSFASPSNEGDGGGVSQSKDKAFTLVELIVVVTILAILATIGFVSYSSYLTGVRDTNRLAQLVSIHDGLELYRTSKDLPLPDESVDVIIGTETIATQGYAGSNTLETIDFTKGGQDPRDGEYFSYYLTDDRKYFQLMAFLEEETNITTQNNNATSPLERGIEGDSLLSIVSKTQAVDYSNRVPTIYGKKLGILTDDENTPIQEISDVISDGELDISSTEDTSAYLAHLTDTSIIEGTVTDSPLQYLDNVGIAGGVASSCKTLIDRNSSLGTKDGVYVIDPEGGSPFPVYCDMSTDGGGWTLIDNIADNADPIPTRTLGANLDLSVTNGTHLQAHSWSGDPQLLCVAEYHTGSKNWATFNVLSTEAKLYPTSTTIGVANGTGGHFSVEKLNGNTYYYLGYPSTDTGLGYWQSIGIWLGYGSSATCSCGYSGVNAGVGGHSNTSRVCSTWVR